MIEAITEVIHAHPGWTMVCIFILVCAVADRISGD